MRQIVTAAVLLALVNLLTACQQVRERPNDLRIANLDPTKAVADADFIILAYPVEQHEIERFAIRDETGPLALASTETTLHVLFVLKGSISTDHISFRHYDAYRQPILVGPPQGPSGGIGARGIFFLRGELPGVLRSEVDIDRPDIPTPWIDDLPNSPRCVRSADCIANVLLAFGDQDNENAFSRRLLVNTAISEQLVGFLKTFQLLSNLVDQPHSERVRRSACRELAKWYALEFPKSCLPVMAGSPDEVDRQIRAGRLREKLERGGLIWVRDRIRSANPTETAFYIEILSDSADLETRQKAKWLSEKPGDRETR